MRRGGWSDIDLADEPGELILAHPGWTADRETLVLGIREAGWFVTTGEAFRAAETAEMKWGWIGLTDESTLVICNSDGLAVSSGESVIDVLQVTLARIRHDA